jgi:hypothetical protein
MVARKWFRKKSLNRVPLDSSHERTFWVLAGDKSAVYDTPYELYEQWIYPTIVTDENLKSTIERLKYNFNSCIDRRNSNSSTGPLSKRDTTIKAHLTCIIGRNYKTVEDVKSLLRVSSSIESASRTYWTDGFSYSNLDLFWYGPSDVESIKQVLKTISRLPSKPVWLVAISYTLRLPADSANKVYHTSSSVQRIKIKKIPRVKKIEEE